MELHVTEGGGQDTIGPFITRAGPLRAIKHELEVSEDLARFAVAYRPQVEVDHDCDRCKRQIMGILRHYRGPCRHGGILSLKTADRSHPTRQRYPYGVSSCGAGIFRNISHSAVS